MNIIDMINKKTNKDSISYEEMKYILNEYMNNNIQDYEMSSLLMAISLNGMNDEELCNLIDILVNNSDNIKLESIDNNLVGSAYVGNVNNKIDISLEAVVISCGCNFIHSEINVPIYQRLFSLCNKIGINNFVPLIAANIISLKVTNGINKFVVNIMVGENSLIKNENQAHELANTVIRVSKKYNCEVTCFIMTQNIPFGNSFGRSVEEIEVTNILKHQGDEEVTDLIIQVASHLVSMDKNISIEEATQLVISKLDDGSACNKFRELIRVKYKDVNDIEVSDRVFSIKSNKTGFIKKIDALKVINLVKKIGIIDGEIDHTVGIVLSKKVGDYVVENEELARVYLNKIDLGINEVLECFEMSEIVGEISPLLKDVIR